MTKRPPHIQLVSDNSPPTNDELDERAIEFDAKHGERTLAAVHKFIGRFVAYPSHHAQVAYALWIVHTHLMDKWDSTPRIAFLSAEPSSGKSRALEVTSLLVPRPMQAVNMSTSALCRSMGSEGGLPTILYDEIDTVFGPKAKENEEIRGLLNAGHRRGQKAYRSVVRGATVAVEAIEAFSALAVAGLGWLPDTILLRSVIIRMRRRHPGERVEPFRYRLHEKPGFTIRDQIARWAATVGDIKWPELPKGIEDRDADVWESLIAIADLVGREWPALARDAAVALVTESKEREPSLGIKLLADLRTVFGDMEHLPTALILKALCALDEAPWNDIKGKPLNDRGLAKRLRQYGVKSKNVVVGATRPKGYSRADLHDAWVRYLPPSPDKSATSATKATDQEIRAENVADAVADDEQPLPNHPLHATDPLPASACNNNTIAEVAEVAEVADLAGMEDGDNPSQTLGLQSESMRATRATPVCAQCNAPDDDGTMRQHDGVWLHPVCVKFYRGER